MNLFLLWLPSLIFAASTASAHTTIDGNNNLIRTVNAVDDGTSSYPRQYKLLLAEEIGQMLLRLKTQYPQFCKLTTSQEAYSLPRSGNKNDCPFDSGGDGCLHYILELQDYAVHPPDSYSSNHLPEVFLSGSLHGDERVGPTAVMEAAALLLQAAACEALPSAPPTSDEYPLQLQEAKSCRSKLASQGVSIQHRQWLARLVTTRRIVIVPTANALGYFRNERAEENMDPNRDFPFDVEIANECFRTIAGRTLNEIFRQHLFQLSLTFHGGTEVIGYEWGAPTYLHSDSPDDIAQHDIAQAFSKYGAGWDHSQPYDFGNMNDKVYYVRGGFEDWAYAGSWDLDRVILCQPDTYTPYPKEKSIYNNSTLRVFNMLVETSNSKTPPTSELGTSERVLDQDTPGNGHVSRNIRLSLVAADMVEPYVRIVGVHNFALSEDIVPTIERTCDKTPVIMIPRNLRQLKIEWSVGGALTIDDTSLWFARETEEIRGVYDCLNQPDTTKIQRLFEKASPDSRINGTTFFSQHGPSPTISLTEPVLGPIFSAVVDVSTLKPSDKWVFLATARVDQGWTDLTHNVAPKGMGAQAHVVNARTNPLWHHESNGKVIQGRLDWWTIVPVTIVVGNYDVSVGNNQDGQEISIIETTNRFGETHGHAVMGGLSPSKDVRSTHVTILIGVGIMLLLSATFCAVMLSWRRDYQHNLIDLHDGNFRDGYHDDPGDDENGDLELAIYNDDDDADVDDTDPLGIELADMSKFSIT